MDELTRFKEEVREISASQSELNSTLVDGLRAITETFKSMGTSMNLLHKRIDMLDKELSLAKQLMGIEDGSTIREGNSRKRTEEIT